MLFRFGTLSSVFACIMVLFIADITNAQMVIDFEDGKLDDWEIIDDVDLGDMGPSTWQIRASQLGLDGNALYQGSNIWGDATDSCLMGTFIIYTGEEFSDFIMEIDVAADDNDGIGLVWAYTDTSKHYRVIMMNDIWPDPNPVDGVGGPFIKIAKRLSDQNPWYELLEVTKNGYVPYAEKTKLHWTLEVQSGNFTFTREDGLSISATDHEYKAGYVGIQLYAQQAEFDNFMITSTAAVRPAGKMATVWGNIKSYSLPIQAIAQHMDTN